MRDFKKQVLSVLEKINSSGSFISAGSKPFCFPGLKIKDMDEISFPVNMEQAKELIAYAHKAPFGKGSQTVLDTTVRSAWEIDAADIQLPIMNGMAL